MQLQLHLEALDGGPAPDIDLLLSLQRWLIDEPSITPQEIGLSTATRPGELSGAVEIISLALGTSLSVGQLLLAIASWRQTRPTAPAVVLTRTEPDGATVRIESADPEAVAAAARALDG